MWVCQKDVHDWSVYVKGEECVWKHQWCAVLWSLVGVEGAAAFASSAAFFPSSPPNAAAGTAWGGMTVGEV